MSESKATADLPAMINAGPTKPSFAISSPRNSVAFYLRITACAQNTPACGQSKSGRAAESNRGSVVGDVQTQDSTAWNLAVPW
jgi:hypothetical protein